MFLLVETWVNESAFLTGSQKPALPKKAQTKVKCPQTTYVGIIDPKSSFGNSFFYPRQIFFKPLLAA
jgi:hypothetical protein